MEKGIAIITGADGGMGREITLALAKEGFQIIMACKEPDKARTVCDKIKKESGNERIEIRQIDLSSLASVRSFADKLLAEGRPVSRLMNNAGVLTTNIRQTTDGLETIVSVNYVGPYLLTRLLLPLMQRGSRIVNTVSCTYAIGRIESDFFSKGKNGRFARIPVYGNTKLALVTLYTRIGGKSKKERYHRQCCRPGNCQYQYDHDACLVRPADGHPVPPVHQNSGTGSSYCHLPGAIAGSRR